MRMVMPRRAAVSGVVVAYVLGMLGCSTLSVDVDRDSAIPIPPGSTWAWGPPPTSQRPEELDPRVNNSIIHGRVQRAVETVLAQKGLTQTSDPSTADFLVVYRVGVRTGRQLVTQTQPVGPGFWPGWGWGYYGPPVMASTREIRYTEGALVIELIQRATGKLAYRAVGRDSDVTRQDASEENIAKVVARLLRDVPNGGPKAMRESPRRAS
jgi:hypothetical protein